jgi:hypothetical protein
MAKIGLPKPNCTGVGRTLFRSEDSRFDSLRGHSLKPGSGRACNARGPSTPAFAPATSLVQSSPLSTARSRPTAVRGSSSSADNISLSNCARASSQAATAAAASRAPGASSSRAGGWRRATCGGVRGRRRAPRARYTSPARGGARTLATYAHLMDDGLGGPLELDLSPSRDALDAAVDHVLRQEEM